MMTIEERQLAHKAVIALSAIAEQLTRIADTLEVINGKGKEDKEKPDNKVEPKFKAGNWV